MQQQPHQRTELPVTGHGRLKLSNWVIGTVPTLAEAQACAQALTAEGFADDDLLIESPTTALQQVRGPMRTASDVKEHSLAS